MKPGQRVRMRGVDDLSMVSGTVQQVIPREKSAGGELCIVEWDDRRVLPHAARKLKLLEVGCENTERRS